MSELRWRPILDSPFWIVVLVAEWMILGWSASLLLPGDPATYLTWLKPVVLVAFFLGLGSFNYFVRRRLLNGDESTRS